MIKLIFAGRNRIIMIRRELPLTTHASPAKGLSQMSGGGFSFVLAPAAADRALELDSVIHGLNGFSFFGKFLLLFFVFGHAAICCLQAMASALIAMAQMKPSNSRATAVMTFL